MSLEQAITKRLTELTPWRKTSDQITTQGRRPVHEKTFKGVGFPFDGITNLGNANVIVPLIAESDGTYGSAILVAQYRPGPEMFLLEFPGGNLKGNESDTGAALRELVEETGHLPKTLIPLGDATPRDAYLEGAVQSYLALGSTKAGDQNLDREEAEQGLFTIVSPISEIAELMYAGNKNTLGLEYHTSLPSAVAFERAMLYMLPRGLLSEKAHEGIITAQEKHFTPVLDVQRS